MGLLYFMLPFFVVSATIFLPSECQDKGKIAGVNNQLAANIYKKLSTGEENIFFSPLGISTALAMLFYGTRGKSAAEMRLGLGYQGAGLTDSEVHASFKSLIEEIGNDSSLRKYILYVANAVLTQRDFPFLPEYRSGLQEIYKATSGHVDFRNEGKKAVQEINSWVKQKTNGQIYKLLDEIDPDTIMIILNAVYFKGTWKTQFDPRNTVGMVFYNKGLLTEGTKVPMMYLVEELLYARLPNAQVVELPYKGEEISMVIILPDAIDGLTSLEQELSPTTFKDMRKLTSKEKVHVILPRFKLAYKKNLNTVLQELGIKDVFLNTANLSGISKFGPIAVSNVVHKAALEVNEEGSEASSVSGVMIETRKGGMRHNEFNVNHPFLFAVIDRRNDMILFQGSVNTL